MTTSPVWALGERGWIPNHGQFDDAVEYMARGNGVDVYLTEDALVLDVWDESTALRLPLSVEVAGGTAEPQGVSTTHLNYFLGDDPSKWAANVPVYTDVVLRDDRTGDELRLRAERGALLYRLTSAAGANAASTPLLLEACEGCEVVSTATDGGILIRIGDTVLEDRPLRDGKLGSDGLAAGLGGAAGPGGAAARGPLEYERFISWHPDGGGTVPPHDDGSGDDSDGDGDNDDDPDGGGGPDDQRGDVSRLLYSTYIGGWDHDRAHALVIDSEELPILAGYTRSSNFPVTSGGYDTSHNGDYDCHVCKFNSDGTELLWATFIGGSLEDRVFAIHQDAAGDLVISGHTYSANFPTTAGAHDRTLGGARDAYVAKLNSTGSVLRWSTYLGGSNVDRAWDMNLDSQGRPVLSGDTSSQDFPTTPGSFQPFYSPETTFSEGFSTKLTANGSGIVWSTFLGGAASDWVKFMDMAEDDSPVLFGTTFSSNFPTTPGAYNETWSTLYDAFVTKLSPDGRHLVFSTYIGGSGSDWGEVIVVLPSGDAMLTGATQSTDFPTTDHAFDRTHNGGKDGWVARLNAAGDSLMFSTYVGGNGDDEPWALTVNADGSPIFSGYVQSTNFPVTSDAFDLTHNGLQDANLTALDPSGSSLIYSTYFGGSDLDGGWELVMHPNGHPILTGPTGSPDFPTTSGAYDETHNGGRDVFLAEFELREPSGLPDIIDGESGSPWTPDGTDSPGTPSASGMGNRIALRAQPNPFFESVDVRIWLSNARSVDVGSVDVGTVDVGTVDVGTVDVGTPDVGTPDVGAVDVGTPDVGTPDVGTPDEGTVDVGTVDARATDPRNAGARALDTQVVDVQVVDATGRRIAGLFHGQLSAGPHTLRWNGRDQRDRAVPAGVYWVRVRLFDGKSSPQTAEERVVLLR